MSATPAQKTTSEILAEVRHEHPELFLAPKVSDWPQGLPKPVPTPSYATCKATMGRELGTGDWIPQERGAVLVKRLMELRTYPLRCQARLDALVTQVGRSTKAICDAAGDGVADVAVTRADVEKVEPDGYGLGTVILWAVVGLAVGGGAAAVVVATH